MSELQRALDEVRTGRMSRRQFMVKGVALGLSISTIGGILAACAPGARLTSGPTLSAAELSGRLRWFASGTDYNKPHLLEPWIGQTGIEIVYTPWNGVDEMQTKLRGGGASLFDTVAIPQQWIKLFADEDLIIPVDLDLIPNWDSVLPQFRDSQHVNFNDQVWGVPWVWGANAIAYNKGHIPEVTSMDVLFSEEFAGKISMRDDPEDSLAVAALYLGIQDPFGMGDDQLAQVKELLVQQAPRIRMYWQSPADLESAFANQEISVAWAQRNILEPLRSGGLDMGWVWPKEGALGFFNGECTINGTDKVRESHAFSNYLIGPEYGVRLGETSGYATTSDLAIAKMSDKTLANVGIDVEAMSRLTFKALIPDRPKWQRIWDEVKAAG